MSRFLLAVCCLIACTACGTRSGDIAVRGLSPLHVNETGESTPVKVRLFQLKRTDRFAAASFDTLWRDYSAALGDDLAGQPTEVTVYPGTGQGQAVSHGLGELAPGVTAVGVMAMYRQADPQDRRTIVVPIAELDRTVLEFSGYSVRAVTP